MKYIILREIKSFFGSPTGYLVVAIFLILNSLFLWVFEGEYNILNTGFADLSPFFVISAWILIFLIPAITMRSFSDEKKTGTIELLLTKPLNIWQIVGGKFFGSFVLIVISIIPTLIYVKIILDYGMPAGNIDFGSTMGSYFGLLFLVSAYTSIGIFASSITDSQIVSFIISVFICFVFYFGIEGIISVFGNSLRFLSFFGMQTHFKSMTRGVLDTRDIIYFMSVTVFFLMLTTLNIKSLQK